MVFPDVLIPDILLNTWKLINWYYQLSIFQGQVPTSYMKHENDMVFWGFPRCSPGTPLLSGWKISTTGEAYETWIKNHGCLSYMLYIPRAQSQVSELAIYFDVFSWNTVILLRWLGFRLMNDSLRILWRHSVSSLFRRHSGPWRSAERGSLVRSRSRA